MLFNSDNLHFDSFKLMILIIKALHSELLAEVSGRFSSRNEYSRDGTSSEKARKTRSDPNFRKTAISETRSDPNFRKVRKKVRNFRVL